MISNLQYFTCRQFWDTLDHERPKGTFLFYPYVYSLYFLGHILALLGMLSSLNQHLKFQTERIKFHVLALNSSGFINRHFIICLHMMIFVICYALENVDAIVCFLSLCCASLSKFLYSFKMCSSNLIKSLTFLTSSASSRMSLLRKYLLSH